MRNFRIYSLSNFQIYHTVMLILVIMLYIISPVCTNFITKFPSFDHLHPIPPSPIPTSGNHRSDLLKQTNKKLLDSYKHAMVF